MLPVEAELQVARKSRPCDGTLTGFRTKLDDPRPGAAPVMLPISDTVHMLSEGTTILPQKGNVHQIEAPRNDGQSFEIMRKHSQPACGWTRGGRLAWFSRNADGPAVENQRMKR